MLGSRSPAQHDHCLPPEFSAYNLLPDSREAALAFFNDHNIPWQAGEIQPSNNLVSSQVQCLNVLAPVMNDAAVIVQLFEGVLPIKSVLPWPDGELVTFEWIGEADYLNEARRGEPRTRGARATSVDVAVRYLNNDDRVEVPSSSGSTSKAPTTPNSVKATRNAWSAIELATRIATGRSAATSFPTPTCSLIPCIN